MAQRDPTSGLRGKDTMPPVMLLDRDFFDIGPGWIGNLVELLFGLLLIAALVAAIVVAVSMVAQRRRGGSSAPATVAASGPQALLDDRVARGEIDEDEYRRRRAVLRGDDA